MNISYINRFLRSKKTVKAGPWLFPVNCMEIIQVVQSDCFYKVNLVIFQTGAPRLFGALLTESAYHRPYLELFFRFTTLAPIK